MSPVRVCKQISEGKYIIDVGTTVTNSDIYILFILRLGLFEFDLVVAGP